MTDSTASVADADTFSVRRSIRIAAPPETVWTAITEPALISRWFGRAEFDGSGAGALGTLSWDDREPIPVRIESVDAPRSISYRWSNDDAGVAPAESRFDRSTVFTFTLDASGDGTLLTVVETGFETTSEPVADLELHRQGWDSELDELISLLADLGAGR
ncbi:SRPBCC domain-containing protein [Galbitalea sp. SE-J8]|uniref:SRPBCC domain-containing protein n=1 Tax=Galbitalea sp. SE-J8 TaxID=3054952 RepID=UPI00259C9A11|nr:SRPBCC domain-containing protein [Galbitalea sp. SE-J8]MDM4763693.1 SRPBCC domain-containing protein [Galbitalea sp. SE-J8]